MSRKPLSKRLLPVVGGIGAALAVREAIGSAREADLHGQVVLITGGSRGLGLALARELADQGCRLAICARDEAELMHAGKELERRGAEVLAVRCDVADQTDVGRMVAAVEEAFGQVDVLICNAGVMQVGQVTSMELEDFRQAMDIMYWGVLYPILAVLPAMRARKRGRIAVITSIAGKISVPRMLPYSPAKSAAIGLAEGLRTELAADGITVTTIVPGLMRTGSYLNAYFSGDDAGRESHYRLFTPLASLPLITASTDGAARSFVRAIRRGAVEHIYPPQFGLVARLHGIAPVLTIQALSLGDRLLPPSGDDETTARGSEIESRVQGPMWRKLTTLGRQAIETYRERPGPLSVPGPDDIPAS